MAMKINLNEIQVATPCPADWLEMQGDDESRFCQHCQKHVYDFSAMTLEEGIALIEEKEGKLCGRLSRRRDGTLITADCPVGLAAKVQQFRKRGLYGLVAVTALVLSFMLMRPRSNGAPDPIMEKLVAWLDSIFGRQPQTFSTISGMICPPSIKTSSVSTGSPSSSSTPENQP
jgi:hypothetical protein